MKNKYGSTLILMFLMAAIAAGCAPAAHMITLSEANRLHEEDKYITSFTNPGPRTDNFSQPRPDLWPLIGINGEGTFKPGPVFHAGEYRYGPDGLTMFLHNDPNWVQEPNSEEYNNVAFFGMRGYRPTSQDDVVMNCTWTISNPFYGTTGCVFELESMVAPDGTIAHFDMVGVTVLGPESDYLGVKNIACANSLSFFPVDIMPIKGVEIYQKNTYQIRLSWQDTQNMTATVSVNGIEKCRIQNIPLYTVEAQIWNDDYLLHGFNIGFQNGGEKWVKFSEVSVWTEPHQ